MKTAKPPKPKKKFKKGCPHCGALKGITVHAVEESSGEAEYNDKNVLVVSPDLNLEDFTYVSAYCDNCCNDIEDFEAVSDGDEDEDDGEDGDEDEDETDNDGKDA